MRREDLKNKNAVWQVSASQRGHVICVLLVLAAFAVIVAFLAVVLSPIGPAAPGAVVADLAGTSEHPSLSVKSGGSDTYINGSQTIAIIDAPSYIQTGSIYINDGGALTITGSNINFLHQSDWQFNIHINGSGALRLTDGNITCQGSRKMCINITGNGALVLENATLYADINADQNASVYANGSRIIGSAGAFTDFAALFAKNSTFNYPLALSDNSTANMTDSSAPSTVTFGDSVLVMYYWLTVNVRDANSVPISGAYVNVSYNLFQDTSAAAAGQSGSDGKAVFCLYSNRTTSGGYEFFGNYNVSTAHLGISDVRYVSLASNVFANVSIQVKPDLRIDTMEFSTPLVRNASAYANLTIKNYGNASSPASSVLLYAGSAFAGQAAVGVLQPGESVNVSLGWTPRSAGYNTMGAYVDLNNTMAEESDANNNDTDVVWVRARGGSAVGVDSVRASDAGPTVQNITYVNATIYNAREAAASLVAVRFYADDVLFFVQNITVPLNATAAASAAWNASGHGWRTIRVETTYLSDYDNKSVQVYVRSPPDIVVAISLSSANITRNQTVVINASAANLGETTASNVLVRMFADGASIYETTVPLLAANSSVNVSAQWAAFPAGTRNIGVFADAAATIAESDETNNNAGAPVYARMLPDILVNALVLPASQTIKEAVNVSASIINIGENGASDFIVTFYENDTPFANVTVTGLAGYNATCTVAMPWSPNTPGPRLIRAALDTGRTVLEENETANNISGGVYVRTKPDISIGQGGLSLSQDYPIEGDVVAVSVTVSNSGETSTSAQISAYHGSGASSILIGAENATLPANGTYTASFAWDTGRLAGARYVWAAAQSSVQEDDLADNEAGRAVTVYSQANDIVAKGAESVVKNYATYTTTGCVLVKDNATLEINGAFNISQASDWNHSVAVAGNATLILNASVLSSGHRFFINLSDNARLVLIRNSEAKADEIVLSGNSSISLSGSRLTGRLRGTAASIAVTSGSKITGNVRIEAAAASFENSTIEGELNASAAVFYIYNTKVTSGLIFSASDANITLGTIEGAAGNFSAPSISIIGSAIKTTSFSIYGAYINITNSTFTKPVHFTNSTARLLYAAAPAITADADSYVSTYWWLTVGVADSAGSMLANATVSAASDMTDYEIISTTDRTGFVRLPVLTNITSGGIDHFVGQYVINITYMNGSSALFMYSQPPGISANAQPATYKFNQVIIPPSSVRVTVVLEKASAAPSSSIKVSGTATYSNGLKAAGAEVRVYIDGVRKEDTSTNANGIYEVQLTLPASAGAYNISVEVAESTWNIPASSTAVAQQVTVESAASASSAAGPVSDGTVYLILGAAAAAGAGGGIAFVFMRKKRARHVAECSECGHMMQAHETKCPNCLTEFDITLAKCSECGKAVPISSKECPNCGTKFTHEEEAEKSASAPPAPKKSMLKAQKK